MKVAMGLYSMLFYGHSETGESGMKKTQLMFEGTLEVVLGEGRISPTVHTRNVPFLSLLGESIGAMYRGEARLSRLSPGLSPTGSLRYKPRPFVMHFC